MLRVIGGAAPRAMADRAVNRPFYERLGFVVTGEENLLGVTNWYIWRDARPA